MNREPFEYDRIFYNEVISHLEMKWKRQLTEHERAVLIEGYRFGRMVEAENQTEVKDRLVAELKKADQFSEELERKYFVTKMPEVLADIREKVRRNKEELK